MELTHILRNFLNADGKLISFPAKRKMKLYALLYLSQKIPVDTDLSEREINDILLSWHTFSDPATLRRELYDFHFIDRTPDGRVYTLSSPQPTMESFSL